MMNYDKVLEDLGEFGMWQKTTLLLLWFPCMMAGAMVLIGSFTLLQPSEYRCKMEDCDVDDFQFGDFEEHWKLEQLLPCSGNSSSDCSGEDDYCVFLKPVALI